MPGRGQYWKEGGLNDSIITSAEIKDDTIATADIANAAVIDRKNLNIFLIFPPIKNVNSRIKKKIIP